MLSMQPVAIVKSVTSFRFKQYEYYKWNSHIMNIGVFDINIVQVKDMIKFTECFVFRVLIDLLIWFLIQNTYIKTNKL